MPIAGPLSEDVQAKIKRQVEFYFSDSNAPRDRFLSEKIHAHPEGYVELALICAFSRMAGLLELPEAQKPDEVPNDVIAKVAEVLRSSTSLDVSEDGQMIKRKSPLKPHEELVREMDERSLYMAPFPFNCSLDALTDFFNNLAPVNCVRMRRNLSTKDFTGSIFVEFGSKEAAEKVLAMEVEHAGAKLRMEPKLAFVERKIQERKERANAHPAEAGTSASANGTLSEPKSLAEAAADGTAGEASGAGAAAGVEEAAAEPPMPEYENGKVLRFAFQGVEEVGDDVHYGMVKEAFGGRDAGVVFVEYNKGELHGQIRMKDKEKAAAVLERRDPEGNIAIGANKAAVELLEGTPEREFYVRANASRRDTMMREQPGGGLFVVQKDNRKRGFQHGRGGRGRFGKRGRSF